MFIHIISPSKQTASWNNLLYIRGIISLSYHRFLSQWVLDMETGHFPSSLRALRKQFETTSTHNFVDGED
jgi:hypothetical protein